MLFAAELIRANEGSLKSHTSAVFFWWFSPGAPVIHLYVEKMAAADKNVTEPKASSYVEAHIKKGKIINQ